MGGPLSIVATLHARDKIRRNMPRQSLSSESFVGPGSDKGRRKVLHHLAIACLFLSDIVISGDRWILERTLEHFVGVVGTSFTCCVGQVRHYLSRIRACTVRKRGI